MIRKIDAALINACEIGNLNEVKKLLNNGANAAVNCSICLLFKTENQSEINKLLLENGACEKSVDAMIIRKPVVGTQYYLFDYYAFKAYDIDEDTKIMWKEYSKYKFERNKKNFNEWFTEYIQGI